jgi:minor extracellular serine protease Vpr
MRRPPDHSRLRRRLSAGAALLAVASVLLVGGSGAAADEPVSGAAGWDSLLGDRPSAQLGGRWIVVLKARSLATRVAAAGGVATEEQERAWTAAARHDQRAVLARLAFHGAPIEPEHAFYRVFNGFATALDARALAIVMHDPGVRGVFPLRAAIPAAIDARRFDDLGGAAAGRRVDVGIPGFSGAGVTVALLDTGVDIIHPYIRGALLPGLDVVDPGGNASARQNPTAPDRPERHGTEMAGLVVGSNGPAGLAGVAPGASLLPIRVAGWQPDTSGGVSVYGRTDQLLAGIELAVDPNEDGDAHDAVRVALVGLVEPFAAFTDGPLAVAAAGASSLDTLVVAPAGNDGPAGPAYGSVGGPGGAPAALTAGAIDTRSRTPTGHVLLLAGLRVLVSGLQPLGGVVTPSLSMSAPVVVLAHAGPAVVGGAGGLSRLFDTAGFSRVAGAAALLPRGTSSPEALREVVEAGARAVLVDGPLPAGSLGTDGPVDVPVLGLAAADAQAVRAAVRRVVPVTLAVGAAAFDKSNVLGDAAPFSSEGLAFDGSLKPDVSAAGVGLATADPGRNDDGTARYGTISGSSAAAALTAGAAVLLAQARPNLDAAGLKQALVASSRRAPGSGIGLVDPSGAAAVELVADPPSVALGVALAEGETLVRPVTLRNVSTRPLEVAIEPGAADAADIEVTVVPKIARVRPGASLKVVVSATVPLIPRAPAALGGAIRVKIRNGATLQIPWTIAVPMAAGDLIRSAVLSDPAFVPSDVEPDVLIVIAGRVDGSADRPQLLPLEQLSIDLYRRDRRLGRLALVRDVLPGRYSFGITGRGVTGRRLPAGGYELRITGIPVGGGNADTAKVPFTIR